MSALTASIVCLQNPRTPANAAPGWIVFDMSLFVQHPDTEPEPELAVALVRFYNRGELIAVKPDEGLFCMAVCSVRSIMHLSLNGNSSEPLLDLENRYKGRL